MAAEPDARTLWCTRCQDYAAVSEWEYRPIWHGWQHMLSLQIVVRSGDLSVRPCGWVVKIPTKV